MLSKAHSGVNPLKIALLDSWLKTGAVLDAGCGNGLYGLHCADKGCDVFQVDVLDRRNKIAKVIRFVQSDVCSCDFDAGSLDSIIAFDLIEHLDDDKGFMEQAKNWLKRGGRLILSVPNEDNSYLEPYGLAHVHFTDKTHRREYTVDSLKALADRSGFRVLSIEPHYNTSLLGVVRSMRGIRRFSRVVAEFYYFQMRLLQKIGLLKSCIVADWFVILECEN